MERDILKNYFPGSAGDLLGGRISRRKNERFFPAKARDFPVIENFFPVNANLFR